MNAWNRIFLVLLLVILFALPVTPADSANDRSIVVKLKASESPDAPVTDTVKLYDASYALVIGIDDYTNGWPRLSNAVRDAEIVADALSKKDFDVTLLKNLDAKALEDAFEKFFVFKGTNPNARLFVWFAGHGHTIGREGYIVPTDAPRPEKKGEFKYKALSMRRFGELVRQAESKHALAIFDSCFSGTVFATSRAMPPPAVTYATTYPVRQFVSSGDANQTVSDDGRFQRLFVRALNNEEKSDLNNDGYITGSELGMFLSDRVSNLTQNAQTPKYGKLRDENYDRGDFVFLLASSGVQTDAPAPRPTWTGLSVQCNISGASVYVDGRYLGTAPIQNKKISPGTHKVKVSKTGYEPYESSVNIRPGRNVTLDAYLEKEAPPAGNLYVNTRPSDAKIRILNIGPKYTRGIALSPGDYHVEVSKSGYATQKKWVSVSAGEDKYVTKVLKQFVADKDSEDFDFPPLLSAVDDFSGAKPPLTGEKITNFLGMEFVYIKPGSFIMGSPVDEKFRHKNETQHRVSLTRGYYIQTTEVTQGQWQDIMGNNPSDNTSLFTNMDNYPIENVSWNDVQEFIKKLNKRQSKNVYRLLTEAEWEYACRAGSTSAYCFGNSYSEVHKYGWWGARLLFESSHPIAQKLPNAWGLYDMHGNVNEWCQDWYGDYPSGSVINPKGPPSGTKRIFRGGCGHNPAADWCRSAFRMSGNPASPHVWYCGFRLAMNP